MTIMNHFLRSAAIASAAALVLSCVATPIAAAAQPSTDAQTAALAATIAATLEGTEHWAVASGFPRHYVIAEIAKSVLVAVDAARAPGAVEAGALDRVLAQSLSTQARAALEIVRRETADD